MHWHKIVYPVKLPFSSICHLLSHMTVVMQMQVVAKWELVDGNGAMDACIEFLMKIG